jgi:hypothetical protein
MSGSSEYGDCQPHGAKDVVHQTLKIPWPISPREIVLEREFRYLPPKKKSNKSVSLNGEDTDQNVTESESSLTGDLLESADAADDIRALKTTESPCTQIVLELKVLLLCGGFKM